MNKQEAIAEIWGSDGGEHVDSGSYGLWRRVVLHVVTTFRRNVSPPSSLHLENGGDKFLRNVDNHLECNKASQPRRQRSKLSPKFHASSQIFRCLHDKFSLVMKFPGKLYAAI
jgi:hypothetical protein